MPSGNPTTIAKPSPTAKPEALTPSGCQTDPVANIFHSVPAIWLGVVKNSLVPALTGTTCGNSSHTASTMMTLPMPYSVGSNCRHTLLGGAAPSAETPAAILGLTA